MTSSVLRVRIGESEVVLPLDRIDEIVRMAALDAVPGASDMIRGSLNLRGEIVIVVDVAPRLGQAAVPGDPSHYIVVARGVNGRYGVLCSDTLGVEEIGDAEVRRELPGRSSVHEVVQLDGRVLPLLDPEALLADLA